MKRNKFSLSNYKLFTCDMGELIPCGLMEVLPGDTVQHSTSALIRVSPLLTPVMHPVQVRIHHWYVPHRLVWEDWEDFITGGPDGMDDSVFPTHTFANPAVGTLPDYMGVPTGANNTVCNVLPFRAYALIYNEFYRDQDLQTPLEMSTASGDDTTTNVVIQNVNWEKDYFTSARPWEQKGPTITIPIGGEAVVKTKASGEDTYTGLNPALRMRQSSDGNYPGASLGVSIAGTSGFIGEGAGVANPAVGLYPSNLYADVGATNALTINVLREAFALQRYQENRARFGSRYVEYLRYLGVRSSDARLQRPEYLGGGKQTIQFSEVLATGASAGVDIGEMKGHGIGAMRSNRYRRFIEEHGYILSLMSVKPRSMYMQGMPRHWNRRTKEDFWQRELQHIGQQEITKGEVYYEPATATEQWGFQDRYDEYRRIPSTISGEFRSTLDMWHFGRKFASPPALNSSFVTSTPTKRVFADQTSDVLWVMANHSIQARRLLARQGTSFIF